MISCNTRGLPTKLDKISSLVQHNRPQYKGFDQFSAMFLDHIRSSLDLFLSTQSPTLVKQIMLFLLCSVYTRHTSSSLSNLEENYAAHREELADPRRGNLYKQILEENTIDSYYYGEFSNCISALVETTRSLIEVMRSRLASSQDCESLLCLMAEMEGHCSALTTTMARLNSSLERRLKLFEVSKNVKEQARNWLLSILASVFLPLSLATSILSMQTRFADLHLLLYDFCGVMVLLATLVLLVLFVITFLHFCRERLAKFEVNHMFGTIVSRVTTFTFFVLLGISWMITMASFLYGMLADVKVGLKILGFGAACVLGISLVFIFGVLGLARPVKH